MYSITNQIYQTFIIKFISILLLLLDLSLQEEGPTPTHTFNQQFEFQIFAIILE